MSQLPPPPPYGGPPGPYPPFPPGPGQQPPQGMSNTAKFWIGAVLALPALFIVGVTTSWAGAAVDAVSGSPDAGGIAAFVVGLLLLAGYVAAIVWDKTRWFAIGMPSSSSSPRVPAWCCWR
jgi:hypothetical protein